jgi:hypothetical protein
MANEDQEKAWLQYYAMMDLDACLPYPKRKTSTAPAEHPKATHPICSVVEPGQAHQDKRNSHHSRNHKP